jgi:hypothetical protein
MQNLPHRIQRRNNGKGKRSRLRKETENSEKEGR